MTDAKTLNLHLEIKLHRPAYKINNRGLVGIGYQWLPMATDNLPTNCQCTIMFLTKFLPIITDTNWFKKTTLFYTGKILAKHWQ